MSKQTKIILAEDDEILSKVIYEELSEAGFSVTRVTDGGEVVKTVQDIRPDLLLQDVLMPNKTGFEILEELKQSPVTKDIPVIMLTMLGSDEDIKKGLKLGANDYIVKSQHAVAEIVEKVQGFFEKESHPEAAQAEEQKPKNMMEEAEERAGQESKETK
jgi:DNA-binding response OmpR family regulator